MLQTIRAGRYGRSALLVSTALVGLTLAVPALAQDSAQDTAGPIGRLDAVSPEAYGSAVTLASVAPDPQSAFVASPDFGIAAVAPEPQILIANPGTPTTARDPVNITGISQMVVSNGGGSIGLCTATLINPRTVIFAAHCVNSRASTAYGANSGGTAIAFGFETFTRANAAGQPDELVNWLLGAGAGPGQFKTNTAQAFYNANQVFYNSLSLEAAARAFLYGDVATAVLDTPTPNSIPTWALLFSQLPAPATIGASGTGYHVNIGGYGGNGTGTSGNLGIDFRRRTAENMIGALTDLKTFETFLFGSSGSPTQNLYFIDFDDPLRGLTGASPFDFNAFRDNAQPNEGTTAGGDSGGPLIIDRAFAKPVIAGVLSGGYTRFFNGQPTNSYGTVSFYQPLYLYWDWIAANNPYHYVGSVAGDANWTDPTHWITNLDPNYQILVNGALVNGLPSLTGAQKDGTGNGFGQACFQNTTSSNCVDVRTGIQTNNGNPIGTTDNGMATVTIDANGTAISSDGEPAAAGRFLGSGESLMEAQAIGGTAAPVATLTNGLPGASNFIPNNADGNRLAGTIGRYFDVTLGTAGTTTLSSAVTIDRFTIQNAGARLNITSTGSLTNLIDTTQVAGVTTVDGTLNSVGDFLIMGGGLTGFGRINAPFTTNVAATIAPGTNGTIGQLTFGGNLVLASASTLAIDLGSDGISDRIGITSTTFSGGVGTNGTANLGGRIVFGLAAGSQVRANNSYTILTSALPLTGVFQTPSAISAILTPTLIYSPNAVQLRLTAGLYTNVVSGASPVQLSYARLLDQNRGQTALLGIYDTLDLQSAGAIQASLEGLAPRTETLKTSMAHAVVDNMSRFYRDRLSTLQLGSLGGDVAFIGQPLQAVARATMPGEASNNFVGVGQDNGETGRVAPGRLPETMSGFLAGGYLDGSSAPMRTAVPGGGRDQFDGWYIAGGIETELGANGAIGFSLSYSDIDGNTTLASQGGSTKLYQGTLYTKSNFGPVYVDGMFSAGLLSSRTARSAAIGTTTYNLRSVDDALAVSGEIGLGAMFGSGIEFGPRVALRGSTIGFSRTNETGGGPALTLDRHSVSSLAGRAGFVMKGQGTIRPFGSASYVHEFQERPTAFLANFVGGGVGSGQSFALGGLDRDWFEVSGGLAIDTGPVEFSISADSTINRDDVETQSYRGSIKFRF